MLPFQIIIILFAIFAISRAALNFRSGRISTRRLIMWAIFWGGVGLVVLVPQTTTLIAGKLGVASGAGLLVYISIILLFYLIFKIYIRLEKIESEISSIVKHIALRSKDQLK